MSRGKHKGRAREAEGGAKIRAREGQDKQRDG
jgi:hypothetical protein